MKDLSGKVALVTGASRGIGRGIAVGLGEAGATVFVTGRTMNQGDSPQPGTLLETANMVTAAGGRAVPVRCDHRRDEEVAEVFATIERDCGRLDILVNNATAVPDLRLLFSTRPFWTVPIGIWDDLFGVGLRSHFVAAQYGASMMLPRQTGLILNISSAGAQFRVGLLPYGVAKAALDRMTQDMAADLKDHGVTVLALWPPPTRTEGMMASIDDGDDPSTWSSPIFTGRVIAALAAQENLMERTGQALRAREVALQLGIEELAASAS